MIRSNEPSRNGSDSERAERKCAPGATSRAHCSISKAGSTPTTRDARGSSGAVDSDNPPKGAPRSIDKAALHRISALPGVRSVVPVVVSPVFIVPPAVPATGARFGRNAQVSNGRVDPYFDSMVGVDLAHASEVPLAVVSGRLPTAGV